MLCSVERNPASAGCQGGGNAENGFNHFSARHAPTRQAVKLEPRNRNGRERGAVGTQVEKCGARRWIRRIPAFIPLTKPQRDGLQALQGRTCWKNSTS